MPEQSQRGGLRNPAGGRPPLPDELRRVRCGWLTLPAWLAEWLKEQPEAAGHIVEKSLIEQFNLIAPRKD